MAVNGCVSLGYTFRRNYIFFSIFLAFWESIFFFHVMYKHQVSAKKTEKKRNGNIIFLYVRTLFSSSFFFLFEPRTVRQHTGMVKARPHITRETKKQEERAKILSSGIDKGREDQWRKEEDSLWSEAGTVLPTPAAPILSLSASLSGRPVWRVII